MYKTEQIKVFIKTKCPACFLIMKQSRKFFCKFQRFLYKFTGIKYRFTRIYHTTSFGGEISASGPGSDFAQTKIIAQEIPFLVQELM